MKKLLITSVILSFLSYLGFWISYGILGMRPTGSSTSYITEYASPDYYNSRSSTIFSGDYTDSGSWTILNKFPVININSAGINTIVTRGDSDRITVRLDNPAQKNIHVEAVYNGNLLTIEARSTNITFLPNVSFGLVSWLEDIFTGSTSGTTVYIEFPESKYDSLTIQQGSGSMKVHDLYADYNHIHIGSGSFEFLRRSESFVSDTFDLELGSGKAVISGMQTESYNISIGSGIFDINNLSGEGVIDMGSGSGSIAYKEYNGVCELDMGSGLLNLFVPENSSIEINADIGSGHIEINACDIIADINSRNDNEYFYLGDGEYPLNVDMGSGYIAIRDRSEYAEPFFETIVISSVAEADVFVQSGSEVEFIDSGILSSAGDVFVITDGVAEQVPDDKVSIGFSSDSSIPVQIADIREATEQL